MLPGMELMGCQDLAVPADIMRHVVRVESSFNPFAIGVAGGHLVRQPRDLREALATVRMLEQRGFNFSLGLAQVNRHNLVKYGLASYEQAFATCPNLQAGSRILAECHGRSGSNWGKAFSCYYSGNFVTGYRHGYVQKIYASMRETDTPATETVDGASIRVVGRPARRAPVAARLPLRAPSRLGDSGTVTAFVEDASAVRSPAPMPASLSPGSDTAMPADGVARPPLVRLTRAGPVSVEAGPAAGGINPVATHEPGVPADDAFVF